MVLHTCVRWLDFVGLTILIGDLAFRFLICRPALLSRQGYQILEGHLRRVEVGSIGLVALTSLADLILRTLMMSGGSVAALSMALPAVLSRTHFGAVWITRIGLLGLLGVTWWLRLLGVAPSPRLLWIARIPSVGLLGMTWWLRLLGVAASPRFIGASFFAASLVALTTTLSGHAADWGNLTVPVLVDWLHLLAVSLWIGGLFTFGFVLKRSLAVPDMQEMVHCLASIAKPFSRMAAACVAVFLLTGLYNTWLQVTSFSPLLITTYGQTLLVKLALVALVLAIAAVNRYYFLTLLLGHMSGGLHGRLVFRTIRRFTSLPIAEKESKGDERIRSYYSRFVRLEWIIVMVALACSALLTHLMPARHIRRHEHLEHHASYQLKHDAAAGQAGGR